MQPQKAIKEEQEENCRKWRRRRRVIVTEGLCVDLEERICVSVKPQNWRLIGTSSMFAHAGKERQLAITTHVPFVRRLRTLCGQAAVAAAVSLSVLRIFWWHFATFLEFQDPDSSPLFSSSLITFFQRFCFDFSFYVIRFPYFSFSWKTRRNQV